MKKIFKKTWRVVSILLLAGLVFILFLQPLYQGFMTRHSIMKALDGAKVVRVVEHSSPMDDYNRKGTYHETIYSDLTLDPSQIILFRQALPLRLDYSGSVAFACIYVEHHRVEIEQTDGKTFILGICFHCGEISLDSREEAKPMPWGWGSSLREFMSSLGLRPDGHFRTEKS